MKARMSWTARLVSRLRCGESSRRVSGYVALDSGSNEKMRGNTGRETVKTLGQVRRRTTPVSDTQGVSTEILEPFAEGLCLTRDRFQYVDSLI
jgi:hypothetical protein